MPDQLLPVVPNNGTAQAARLDRRQAPSTAGQLAVQAVAAAGPPSA